MARGHPRCTQDDGTCQCVERTCGVSFDEHGECVNADVSHERDGFLVTRWAGRDVHD